MWSKFHRQWQQCPTPELVNTTSSKVNKQLEEARFYRLTSFNQIQTKIDVFYFDENIFWHKPILPAKTIFASPVFTVVHKPRSKDIITYRLWISVIECCRDVLGQFPSVAMASDRHLSFQHGWEHVCSPDIMHKKSSFAKAVCTSAIQLQYKFFTTAASSLQVTENLYGSVVLQGSAQVQYNCNTRKKILILKLCCSCIAPVWTT